MANFQSLIDHLNSRGYFLDFPCLETVDGQLKNFVYRIPNFDDSHM